MNGAEKVGIPFYLTLIRLYIFMCSALLYYEGLLLHCIFSDKGRKYVLDAETLPVMLDVLEQSISDTGEGGRTL